MAASKIGVSAKFFNIPVLSLPQPSLQIDFEFGSLSCNYIEYVFCDSSNEVDNDKSSFLLRKATNTDTIVFEIWKSGVKQADITDDTFGDFYPTFDEQPLYTGVIIDWQKVKDVYGFGCYTIVASQNIASVDSTFTSRCFKILPFNAVYADKTVRIESYQKGNILPKAKKAYQQVAQTYDSVWARLAQQRLNTLELAESVQNS